MLLVTIFLLFLLFLVTLFFCFFVFVSASKECSRPETPKHGERIGNDFSVGKKVWYICDDGFAIHGSMMLQCLGNRTWSKPVPVCQGNNKTKE